MNLKNKTAIFSIGERTFEIPVHEELVKLVEASDSALKFDNHELNRFVFSFLTRRTATAYLRIGFVTVPFELPVYVADSLELEASSSIPADMLSEDLGQIIRKMIPTDLRPATERQLTFSKHIASTLSIDFPDSVGTSFLLCSEFIDKHIEAFNERALELKTCSNNARRAARGYAAVWLISSTQEKKINDIVLGGLNIAQEATVHKYLHNLSYFLEEYTVMEQYFRNFSLQVFNELIMHDYPSIGCPQIDDEKIHLLIKIKPNFY